MECEAIQQLLCSAMQRPGVRELEVWPERGYFLLVAALSP